MRKRREEQPDPNKQVRWMLTYTDLCTLLLTFFVLLVSMSSIDETRQRRVLHSLVGAFGMLPGGRSALGKPKGKDVADASAPMVKATPVDYEMLRSLHTKHNLDVDIVKLDKDRTILRIDQKVLFPPGSATLRPEAQEYLSALAGCLDRSGKGIDIGGHVDRYEGINDPHWSERAWILSAERAQAVYFFFVDHGITADRMSAHGFGFTRPLYDSADYPHLRERNQRIEIALGPNQCVPSSLAQNRPHPSPYFNYKDFFFRLFPPEESNGQPRLRSEP